MYAEQLNYIHTKTQMKSRRFKAEVCQGFRKHLIHPFIREPKRNLR